MKEHVAIVIRNKKNEILFIKRSLKKKTLPGAWSFPSGTLERGEDIKNTLIREAREELNIDVQSEKILAIKDLPEFDTRLIFMLCKIKSGEPIIKELDEIDEIKWMKFSDFFKKFSDDEIGHGLIWLRQKTEIWNPYD